MPRPYIVSCHCNAVRIEVDAEPADLRECNCSVCQRSGFLYWYLPGSAVRLLTESPRLSTYVRRYLGGSQHFCATCGTPILRTGYKNQSVAVNARCLEGIDVFELETTRFDGRKNLEPGPMPPRL
jgi:hypothetical protein